MVPIARTFLGAVPRFACQRLEHGRWGDRDTAPPPLLLLRRPGEVSVLALGFLLLSGKDRCMA